MGREMWGWGWGDSRVERGKQRERERGGGGRENTQRREYQFLNCSPSFTFTYPLTAGVVRATKVTSQQVSSIFLWDWVNSRPVKYRKLSSHLFFCLPRLLFSFTVPCKMVLARPGEREACPYHFSLRWSGGLRVVRLGWYVLPIARSHLRMNHTLNTLTYQSVTQVIRAQGICQLTVLDTALSAVKTSWSNQTMTSIYPSLHFTFFFQLTDIF